MVTHVLLENGFGANADGFRRVTVGLNFSPAKLMYQRDSAFVLGNLQFQPKEQDKVNKDVLPSTCSALGSRVRTSPVWCLHVSIQE